MRRYLRWYINPIVEQQNAYNDAVARTLRLLADAYAELAEQTTDDRPPTTDEPGAEQTKNRDLRIEDRGSRIEGDRANVRRWLRPAALPPRPARDDGQRCTAVPPSPPAAPGRTEPRTTDHGQRAIDGARPRTGPARAARALPRPGAVGRRAAAAPARAGQRALVALGQQRRSSG